jgi:lipopolysaccharide transport system ATP-binding protein
MKPIIEVRGLGKKYNIRQQRGGYISLREVLMNTIKHPFAFAKDKAKTAVGMAKKDEFWALKDVSFSVNRGEVIGIIGANGAGKSTLLKILTGITPPTEGEAILRGHVSSLLEVGTGFHPELTGRENIFLNGAILGMKHAEMQKKFNSIVEFAGIERFLDTPVKRYSSGMYVRLAFSVAAHIEPDILLVDEVLAVGDAEFQKKCLGKMDEVTKKQGRTILFVSHNMAAVQSLCERSILIEGGRVALIGKTNEVIGRHLSKNMTQNSTVEYPENTDAPAVIRKITLTNKNHEPRSEFSISEPMNIGIDFTCHKEIHNSTISILVYSRDRDLLLYSSDADSSGKLSNLAEGKYHASITIPDFLFNVGKYSFDVLIHCPNIVTYATVKDIGFEIKNTDNPRSIIFQGKHLGKIATILPFLVKKNK